MTEKTAEQWQEDLNLDGPPDGELLTLLNRFAGQETAPVPPKGSAAAATAAPLNLETLQQDIQAMHAAQTVGKALAAMRGARRLGVREMGRKLGLTGSAVVRMEKGENAELATVARYAAAAGYRVRLLLEPEDSGPVISTSL